MGTRHVIELNGKRYDTVTGKLIDAAKTAKPSPKPHQSRPTQPQTRSSATKPSKPSKPLVATPPRQAAAPATPTPPKTGMVDGIRRSRTTPNHLSRRHPQKSHTLMRQAAQAASSPIELPSAHRPEVITHPEFSTLGIDAKRLQRAKSIPQNKFIGRFTPPAKSPHVATPSTPRSSAAPVTPPAISATAPAPRAHPFEAAIAQATSHTQPKQPKTRAHRVSRALRVKHTTLKALAVVLVVGLAGGFVMYQQMPNIHMKLARSRSGVTGVLPAYTPAGYKLSSDIDYKPGEITLNFQSNSDQRAFNVVQSQSSWTSESLRKNFLEPSQTNYQTVEENGKTVYLYGNNATWVDGGVWYKVEAKNAQLSSTQLANLVKGL